MVVWARDHANVCEVHGTRREVFTRHSFEAEVVLQVPLYLKEAVITDLWELGSYPLSTQPYASPPYLEVDAHVVSIVVTPFFEKATTPILASGEAWNYPFVYLKVKWSTNAWGLTYIERELLDLSVESQIQDHKKFLWKSDKKQVTKDEAPVRQIRSAVYTVITYGWFYVKENYVTLIGTVNDKKYKPRDIGTFEFAPETMLYVPGDISPDLQKLIGLGPKPIISRSKQFVCKWLVKLDEGSTWNKFYRPNSDLTGTNKGYESLEKNDDPAWKLYPTADHSDLLPGTYGP